MPVHFAWPADAPSPLWLFQGAPLSFQGFQGHPPVYFWPPFYPPYSALLPLILLLFIALHEHCKSICCFSRHFLLRSVTPRRNFTKNMSTSMKFLVCRPLDRRASSAAAATTAIRRLVHCAMAVATAAAILVVLFPLAPSRYGHYIRAYSTG